MRHRALLFASIAIAALALPACETVDKLAPVAVVGVNFEAAKYLTKAKTAGEWAKRAATLDAVSAALKAANNQGFDDVAIRNAALLAAPDSPEIQAVVDAVILLLPPQKPGAMERSKFLTAVAGALHAVSLRQRPVVA